MTPRDLGPGVAELAEQLGDLLDLAGSCSAVASIRWRRQKA